MRRLATIALGAIAVSVMAYSVAAAVPATVNYQAVLTADGVPVTTPVLMTFRIYDNNDGGNVLWTEVREVEPDAGGLIHVRLGEVNPIPDSAFAGPESWLSVQVLPYPELLPMILLTSSPYSFRVGSVDGALGGAVTGALSLNHSPPAPNKDAAMTDDDAILLDPDDERGPLMGVRDPGGGYTSIMGGSTDYYEDVLAHKDIQVLSKKVEVGLAGLIIFGATEEDTIVHIDATGKARIGWGNQNTGNGAFVLGSQNTASGDSATITGGNSNLAAGFYSTVSGGLENQAWGSAVVSGGQENVAGGFYSVVGGGLRNGAGQANSTIGGGMSNEIVGPYSWGTIAGGADNEVTGSGGAIGGGNYNKADDTSSVVSGGRGNRARGRYSVVGGGGCNFPIDQDTSSALGAWSVIDGGRSNIARGDFSSIGGGHGNWTGDTCSVVSGGRNNYAHGAFSTISGGIDNETSDTAGTVGGGRVNQAHLYGTVAGGTANYATGPYSAIAGGFVNIASGYFSAISGGWMNTADSSFACIAGGYENQASGQYASILGGYFHEATALGAAVVGGSNALSSGTGSVVCGGTSNNATAAGAAVLGGYDNDATASYAAAVGGSYAVSSGIGSVVCGGAANHATAQGAAVLGGQSDSARGVDAIVLGGARSVADGDFSLAGGYRAKARHDGAFVWADNSALADFESERDHQFRVRAFGGADFTNDNSWYFTIYDDDVDLVTTSTGAHLTVGGTWANSSDRDLKENFRQIDPDLLLARLDSLPISEWNYRAESSDVRHLGPVAQDFYRLFGLGADDGSITTVDPVGVALAAIQELHRRNQSLERQIAELRALIEQSQSAAEPGAGR